MFFLSSHPYKDRETYHMSINNSMAVRRRKAGDLRLVTVNGFVSPDRPCGIHGPVIDCPPNRMENSKMKYSEAKQGRTFVIRLEDGEVVHEQIERFARDHSINAAALIIVGGADKGSRFIVGPEQGRGKPLMPMEHILDDVHEIAGVGTLFPDEKGDPMLHMHTAGGRKTSTITGCVRNGVKTWHILEVILFELVDSTGVRDIDPETGFKFLVP